MHNKPRRSSLRLCPEPLKNDSVYEPNTRRVSFSRTIFICGAEMEVSQLPLSRVSDESVEVTRLDSESTSEFISSIPDVSMDTDHAETYNTGNSMLTEVTRDGEPQSVPPDAVALDMSVEPLFETPSKPDSRERVSEGNTSIEMSVCSDPTPKRMRISGPSMGLPVQSNQCEVEMDMSVDRVDMACDQSHQNITSPLPKGENPKDTSSQDVPQRASPTSNQQTERSLIVRDSPAADLSETDQEQQLREESFNITGTSELDQTLKQVSPEVRKTEDREQSPAEQNHVYKDDVSCTPLAPVSSFADEEMAPRSSAPRLLFSLPPLRLDRTMEDNTAAIQTGNSKICHTLRGTRERSSHRQQLVSRLGLQMDGRLMSQSLATTPLRQVPPKDWIQATVMRCGDSVSHQYDVARRYQPDYLLPSVSRLQSHVTRLSSYHVPEKPDPYVGTSLPSLQEFLDHNANVSDKENVSDTPSSMDFENFLRNELGDLPVKEELINRWLAALLSNQCRIRLWIDMYERRQSEVLLRPLPSTPVAQQLNKMSEFERFDFIAQAHQRLHQCINRTREEFRGFQSVNLEALEMEKQSIMDTIHQFESELDKELSTLESELEKEKNISKQLRDITNQLKDKSLRLKNILEETAGVTAELNEVQLNIQRVSKAVSSAMDQSLRDSQARPDLIPGAPGVTEMFVPLNAFAELTRAKLKKNVQDLSAEEVANRFAPSDLICLSYGDHVYAIRTLFGLVRVVVTCHPTAASQAETDQPMLKPDQLIIQTVDVISTPANVAPVDCDAVHLLAENVVSLCNSHEGRTQLCSRLIGLTLEKSVWHVEHALTPYFLLAGDLRAIYLSGHSVKLECTPPLDLTLTTPGQRSLLHRSVMSVSVSGENSDAKPSSLSAPEWLSPAGPYTVTIKICHRDSLSVLLVRIVLHGMDSDIAPTPEASIRVLLGQIDSEELDRLIGLCRAHPGQMYKAIQSVQERLSRSQCI